MKTIEEREEICAKRELPHNNGTIQWRDGYREGLKVGYHFGATEQNNIVCKAILDKCVVFDKFGRPIRTMEELIKALEE